MARPVPQAFDPQNLSGSFLMKRLEASAGLFLWGKGPGGPGSPQTV